jgi:hypothetical protein
MKALAEATEQEKKRHRCFAFCQQTCRNRIPWNYIDTAHFDTTDEG